MTTQTEFSGPVLKGAISILEARAATCIADGAMAHARGITELAEMEIHVAVVVQRIINQYKAAVDAMGASPPLDTAEADREKSKAPFGPGYV